MSQFALVSKTPPNCLERSQFALVSEILPKVLKGVSMFSSCLLPLVLAVLSILYSDVVLLYLQLPCTDCLGD